MKRSRITLLGAGPGDPELITLKGVKALQNADAVLYDALVHPALLEHVAENIPQIYVGKRSGNHSMSQQEINEKLVDAAKVFGHAVRLKGGDPFVFGRGFEELEFAKSQGIPVEIIPGISSSTAVPGLSAIPLTVRGLAESFWVVTASTKKGELSADLIKAAQSNATVVVLMGFNKLPQIVELYKSFRKVDLGIAVIQDGSLKTEQKVVGTIDTILDKVWEAELSTPAILVIGETVNLVLNEIEQQKTMLA